MKFGYHKQVDTLKDIRCGSKLYNHACAIFRLGYVKNCPSRDEQLISEIFFCWAFSIDRPPDSKALFKLSVLKI